MLITLEPHGVLRSKFACLFILTLSRHCYANGDEALLRIILDSRGLLVKMLITLERHCIFLIELCMIIH